LKSLPYGAANEMKNEMSQSGARELSNHLHPV
jgi:hypothetical protein